jgi:TonB dependent receptor/Carboxypeptidase regulatory-like domain/TonB-dependent Receptor Plug Domain
MRTLLWLGMLACLLPTAWSPLAGSTRAVPFAASGDLAGTVRDSTNGQPLAGAEIVLFQGASVVARTEADALGQYRLHDLAAGAYTLDVRAVGYRPLRRPVTIGTHGAVTELALRLVPAAVQLGELSVTTAAPVAIDTRSGDQVFQQNDYHGAPTLTTSQIVQQSVAGAARAPTGEVHIRGQHAEYTYYIDGVPVPPGISGSLNELFDPNVVDRIDFQTGAWDAEYGNKNAAIVNVNTRIPAGGLQAQGSTYVGSFVSNGQSVAASQNVGRWGWFASGARQRSGMRREPVMFDTLTDKSINFHNDGTDLFGFGKVQYLGSASDIVNLEGNWSRTRSQVPFDSTGGVSIDDNQQDVNGFVNLTWRHQFGAQSADTTSTHDERLNPAVGRSADLLLATFHRWGSLTYTPGLNDTPQFVFFPDTTTPFNLSEDRNFNTTGIKADYTWRSSEHVQVKVGGLASLTRGHEDFETVDAAGAPGPASNSDLKGNDEWAYAQTALAPNEKLELRTGLRFDNHEAPFAGGQNQLSPRIKLSFFPSPATTLYAYYGRLFVPTNVEDLRAITSAAQADTVTVPTLPERDDFYELGVVHRFPYGVVAKLSAYAKRSSPGIDDNTVPGSSIVTSVNIDRVWVNGLETVLEVRPAGRLSGYMNLALAHAYGRGPITGGFFPSDNPEGYFDLDHDQRLSGLATINYADSHLFASVTGTYGSGLTNGADPDSTFRRGLFEFNKSIKVSPSLITDVSAGYLFNWNNLLVRPEVYVSNVFNHSYLLKGAFFSGAAAGRPRSVLVRLNLGV